MRNLLLIMSLLISTASWAQDTTSIRSMNPMNTGTSSGEEPVFFTFDDQEYKFVPNALGYHIMKMENGTEVDYGTLMLTSDDGYYALTSNLNDHVSYGRFDDAGNFKALRYDEASDSVLEENFMRKEN